MRTLFVVLALSLATRAFPQNAFDQRIELVGFREPESEKDSLVVFIAVTDSIDHISSVTLDQRVTAILPSALYQTR